MLKSHFFNTFNSKLIIISSIICLILSHLFNETVQSIAIMVGILTFGVIHGANDIILLSKNLEQPALNSKYLILLYSLLVLLSAIFFFYFPVIALTFFVLYSSYHFGEQQWTLYEKKKTNLSLLHFSYGLFIFSMLFIFNEQDVSKIIYDITAILITENQFLLFFIISFSGLCLSLIFFYKEIIRQLSTQLVLIVLLSLLFYSSDLMLSFAVYFVFWHSIPSIVEQTNYIFGQNSYTSFIQYFKKAFIYWIVSMVGLVVFFYFLKDDQVLLTSVFFSFLAAITLPHTLVIFRIKIK
ncbi:MAG: hypothetical protein CMC53_01020 [Flavobacteriaceae bacterium]|nr:hypothetical protein [Flavobacteriaceae bacterium]